MIEGVASVIGWGGVAILVMAVIVVLYVLYRYRHDVISDFVFFAGALVLIVLIVVETAIDMIPPSVRKCCKAYGRVFFLSLMVFALSLNGWLPHSAAPLSLAEVLARLAIISAITAIPLTAIYMAYVTVQDRRLDRKFVNGRSE